MKFIVGLSSLALFSLSSVSPCLAANQLVSLSAGQSLPSTTKTIQEGNSFTQVINTVDRQQKRVAQLADREQWFQQRRYRAQQAARARQAAAAARREQERKYFESLTPDQQRAYLAQKRARQEAAAKLLLTIFGGGMIYENSGTAPSSNANQDTWIVEDRYNNPSGYQPAPAPVAPIDPFYGTGPGGKFYGN
ncbi:MULTISPECIES: hypothetical protein [Nostocales]|uniref:Uncharacterized protein n=3 Tax=Nostocales TaxID=1161 RepID=A0A0C1QM78_9CYAN|nr:hypothetical protein [Tolypothrix bouteillei]KAF3890042.1 hypothetical protein DA73_0400034735 [Tolypothrix bouteillei VB521301]